MIEGWIDTGDVRLWRWDTGGDGPAVVFCHPASQSSEIWRHQREAFAAAGFRVLAYDRRGVGQSDPGPDGDPGTTVGDLFRLLDVLKLGEAHLIGAAAGGGVACAFAVTFPARTLSLTIAGSIVAPNEAEWREMFGRLEISDLRRVLSIEALELGPSYRAGSPDGVAEFGRLSKAAKAEDRVAQPIGADVTWRSLEAMDVPTLLLTGEADLFAPPPLQKMIARHIRSHRLETLREVGHAAYWEAPDAFNRIVLDFLKAQTR